MLLNLGVFCKLPSKTFLMVLECFYRQSGQKKTGQVSLQLASLSRLSVFFIPCLTQSVPFSRVITNDSSKITVIHLGSVDLHPVFLTHPQHKRSRKRTRETQRTSMKQNLTSVCAPSMQPRSPFLCFGGIFPYIGPLNLCTLWVLYGVKPKCRWSYRWIL